jgi:hypothetical protein
MRTPPPAAARTAATALAVAASTLAAALASACATAPRGAAPAPLAYERSPRHLERGAITVEPSLTMYEVVERRWPTLIRGALPFTAAELAQTRDRFGVYANGVFLGGPEALRTFPAHQVEHAERVDTVHEQMRFGRRHPAGGVVLTLRDVRLR